MIFSLLVHEYGHALTAVYFGARPIITLEAFGGKAQYNGYGMTVKQQFLITLNGPLLESALIILPYFLLKADIFESYQIRYLLYVTMRLNIFWCLLNLIPVAPLDGGQLMRYFLETKFEQQGYKASLIVGLICAVLAAPYLYYQEMFFFGTLLLIFGFKNYQALQEFKLRSSEYNPFSRYIKALECMNNNDLSQAKALLKRLLKSKDKQMKNLATESLAQLYFQEHEGQKSYQLLLKSDHQSLKKGKRLLCQLAFERQNYELVGQYAKDIYELDPSYETALLNSKTFAHLNQPALARAWLEAASQFREQKDIKDLLQDPADDLIQEQAEFKR